MCLYMPRCNDRDVAPDECAAGTVEPEVKGRGEAVLVVEEKPGLRMLVTEIPGDSGYTTLKATDRSGALEILESDVRIDLLITMLACQAV